jgi:hypothetical protein
MLIGGIIKCTFINHNHSFSAVYSASIVPETIINSVQPALLSMWISVNIWFSLQSLRSRGIRFPGRDDESLAPIFTPPRSVPAAEPYADAAQDGYQEIPEESFAPVRAAPSVQVDEAFEVARNSVELLSTVLSSSPQSEALEVSLCSSLPFKSSCLGDKFMLFSVQSAM